MPDITNTVYDKMLDAFMGKATYTAETPHIALFDGDPQSGGSEVTTTVRTAGRIALASLFGNASNGSASNSSIIDFGPSDGAASVSHYAIMDASTAGNVLASDTISGGAQTITTSDPVAFAIGALSVSFTG